MAVLILEPASLHEGIWSLLNKHNYGKLKMAGVNEQKITLEIITSLIREIFRSTPVNVYDDAFKILERFVDEESLAEYAYENQFFARDYETILDRNSKDLNNCFVEVLVKPPISEMVYVVFFDLVDELQALIFNAIKDCGKEIPGLLYRFVEFDVVSDRRGRIKLLKLLLGEDIRHVFFRTVFKDGRYDPSVLEKLSLPEIDNGFRYDGSTGVVSLKSGD